MKRWLQDAEEKLKCSDREISALQQVVQSQRDGINKLRLSSQERHEKEPRQKENFQTELVEKITRAKQELSDLHTQREVRGKIWAETRRQLEQTFKNNEKTWQQQISQL